MFLSRLALNFRHAQARKDLANPYEMHRTLKRACSEGSHPLYRVEDNSLLVQTAEQPNWDQLLDGYLAREAEFRPLQLGPWNDLPVRFRLRANPCVTHRVGQREDGKRKVKRFPIKGIVEQLDWLSKQGERCGFKLLGAMVSQSGDLRIVKGDSGPLRVHQATFDGHLRVVAPDLFGKAVRDVVGHGKSWGLGLMSVSLGS